MTTSQVPTTRRTRRDIANRGSTSMSKKVLEKITSQVAQDETQAGGTSGGFLGIGSRADFSARPDADVELAGNIASLKVTVGLPYPLPLRRATDQLRQRIAERVTDLTGVQVRQVDITIAWLKPKALTSGRRQLL
ncbi:Asp23/Gls24 family envelope stress response protein [Arthrobacter sp.]|uniref:Asp23/Gls24 family envelope stress response protein n=1 Tax=Arthrobacter sp. TaxID=1667 RepID=UPI00289BC16E|nr:Asp23/Gls24 family envelope stress response protein [Arthrobacter sp.]